MVRSQTHLCEVTTANIWFIHRISKWWILSWTFPTLIFINWQKVEIAKFLKSSVDVYQHFDCECIESSKPCRRIHKMKKQWWKVWKNTAKKFQPEMQQIFISNTNYDNKLFKHKSRKFQKQIYKHTYVQIQNPNRCRFTHAAPRISGKKTSLISNSNTF